MDAVRIDTPGSLAARTPHGANERGTGHCNGLTLPAARKTTNAAPVDIVVATGHRIVLGAVRLPPLEWHEAVPVAASGWSPGLGDGATASVERRRCGDASP